MPSHDELAASLAASMTLTQIAKQAGISLNYASQLARDYGIPVRGQKDYNVHQHPLLTRDWLTTQYVTRSRSMRDIAAEAGVSKSTIMRWARIYRLPIQTRFPIRMDITAAKAAAPPILRPAITGPSAWKRLNRLAAASTYSSLTEAAGHLGIEHSVLSSHVNRLERELGHRLLNRAPGQHAMQPTDYGRKIITAIRTAERRRALTTAARVS